jgi:hypothetical protein
MILLAQTQVPDGGDGSSLWFYIFMGVIAFAIFLSGVFALRWSMRKGDFPSELEKFDRKALTIFNDEEPVGVTTDYFPGKGPKPGSSGTSRGKEA